MLPGIDVSHWQGDIDWAKVKAAGVKFAFLKSSEFPDKKLTMFADDKFVQNRKGAEENGIYWGAYHFFRTHIDPVTQAEAFCKLVGTVSSLPLVLDLEVAGCKGTQLVKKVKSFVEAVTSLTSRKPIIYTSGGFWRPYMTYQKLTDVDWAVDYPLWMARYTTQWPGTIYPWSGWDFWQYSDSGRIPGIKGSVDLNWFAGSLEDLQERFLPAGSQAKDFHQEMEKKNDYPVDIMSGFKDIEERSMDNSAPEKVYTSVEPEPVKKVEKEQNSKENKNPSFLTFLHNKFNKNKKKTVDPLQSQEWIEDVVYRGKE